MSWRVWRPQWETLILELGFNMMYLVEPWMFSVHNANQVTLLSWRTSFHLLPAGGLGCLESLRSTETREGWKQWGQLPPLEDLVGEDLPPCLERQQREEALRWLGPPQVTKTRDVSPTLTLWLWRTTNQDRDRLVFYLYLHRGCLEPPSGRMKTYLLQLMMTSSGVIRLFNMPILGWSPRSLKSPGGSMRKFPIRSLWLSMMQ